MCGWWHSSAPQTDPGVLAALAAPQDMDLQCELLECLDAQLAVCRGRLLAGLLLLAMVLSPLQVAEM
jgi:hypothetical protein